MQNFNTNNLAHLQVDRWILSKVNNIFLKFTILLKKMAAMFKDGRQSDT